MPNLIGLEIELGVGGKRLRQRIIGIVKIMIFLKTCILQDNQCAYAVINTMFPSEMLVGASASWIKHLESLDGMFSAISSVRKF